MKLRHLIRSLALVPLTAWAAPEVTDEAVGNVTTTSFSLSWQTGETAAPGIEVFADAAATDDLTAEVRVEHQYLLADRREVASTAATRDATRTLRAAMNARGVFLTRVSGLRPDTTYWVRGLALDTGGNELDAGDLIEVTTARDSVLIAESRQLVVDFSGAAVLLGDLGGAVVRLQHAGSAHPLIAVINDVLGGNRCYFDLCHLLDAAGELPLNPGAGTTLTLDIELLGTTAVGGEYQGNQVNYDGGPLAARASEATFSASSVELLATADRGTALLGHPVAVNLRAIDSLGTPLVGFDRALSLESPAISGGGLTSEPLTDGRLDGQPLILMSPGSQTVTVSDPVSGAVTTIDFEVLEYSYENFRIHYFGDPSSPEGDPDANGDGDPYSNLLEFAFGLDPGATDGEIQFGPGGGLVERGGPVTTLRIDHDGVDFRVTFLRPKNHAALGIAYTPQFSSNLSAWFDSDATPTVLEEDGKMELVSVPYPYFTPEPSKARFFQIKVQVD